MGKDGGQAFPISYDGPSVDLGMSLRDWFAGQALAGTSLLQAYHNRPDLLAQHAYEYADAMLAEREKGDA